MRNFLISKIGGEVLDLLYPPGLYCNCCSKITDKSRTYGLCNDCMEKIKWIGNRRCSRCGKSMAENDFGDICRHCRHHEHIFDKGYACCEYGMHEKTLLYELKYASKGNIARHIGEMMYDRMSAEIGEGGLRESFDLLVPIPIHYKRRGMRGFNQADLIAEELSARSGIALDCNLLLRTKETGAMKGLGPAERKANIQGAFEIRESRIDIVQGRRILMVEISRNTSILAEMHTFQGFQTH